LRVLWGTASHGKWSVITVVLSLLRERSLRSSCHSRRSLFWGWLPPEPFCYP
jgi:hypothetical protein